jgi:SnoaL-like polyketide cyclase
MEIVEGIGEGDKVVARFRYSGTHEGEWRGTAATGRRFENVDEVYSFTVRGERIVDSWGIEDTLARMRASSAGGAADRPGLGRYTQPRSRATRHASVRFRAPVLPIAAER